MGLQFYIQDAQALLHDQSALFTSVSTLTRWINLGRRETARLTGCIQRVIMGQSAFGASAQPGSFIPGASQPGALPGAQPNANLNANATQNSFTTIVGVERYPYIGFANSYLTAQYAGLRGISDTISVSVSYGGTPRPSLVWMPWDTFQAYCRAYSVLTESFPAAWSTFNDGEAGEVWMFPVPMQGLEMEWLTFCVPADLNTDSDFDAIPTGFQNAVKFFAAGMGFMTKQRPMDARVHFDMFLNALGVGSYARDSGKTGNYYPQVFRR